MIFPNLTADLTYQLVQDYAKGNRAAQLAYYEERYRELEGEVFSSSGTTADMRRIWPKRFKESDAAYKERVKIWPQMSRIICNRLASILLKGKVQRNWVPLTDADQTIADAANELQELMDEANNWDAKASDVYFFALGVGEISLWPEFRRFDKFTGQPYTLGKGQGVPIWSSYFPWFAEPIVLQDYAEEIIGAAKLLTLDNMLATPLVSRQFGVGNPKNVTEIWASPLYDRMTGTRTTAGFYRKWIDDKPAPPPSSETGATDKRWWTENLYACNPVVFFTSGDPDESQHRGKSYVDRFHRLIEDHARTISDIGQAIALLPNVWKYTGEQKAIDRLVIRTNMVVQIPEHGIFEQAARELNLTEDWNLKKELEHLISLAAVLPMEVWDVLPAGKVESGVALKLLFQPLQEQIQNSRLHFGESEKQRMRVGVSMFNTHNPQAAIDQTRIRPEVVYDENIIPVDDAIEIASDIQLLTARLRNRVKLVRKYNPEIATDEQALEFIADRDKEDQAKADAEAKRQAAQLPRFGQLARPGKAVPTNNGQ